MLAIVGFVLAMVVLGVLLRGKRPFRKRWGNVCFALLGALVSFGVLTGSAMATISAIGNIMAPEMDKDGYPKGYTAAMLADAVAKGQNSFDPKRSP